MSYYLSIILFTPLAGAFVLLLVNKENENAIRWIANVVAFLGFVVSVPLWFWFDPRGADFQFVERAAWIPSVGAEYFLGVDGLSTLLILLTTLMGTIAVLSSWTAIKVPMFPFHTWLPDAHTDAPTAGSVILAAVLLKMGTYGFLRFSLPILPDASHRFVPMMVVLSIIGIVYGALVALAQKDWKRLVAYSSVSHMALVMLGMFALNPVGITGSIVHQLNHGISTGALFLLVGIVYERRHTREISEYGGLSKVMPVYAAIFLIMTMSSIGLPTLNGFIGELLILQGVFAANKVWAAFAASGVVLGAAYMLYLYQRTMFGKIENPKNERLADLSHREFATFAPLIVLAVWIGLYPTPFLVRLDKSVQNVVARVNPTYAQKMAADCGAPARPPTAAVAAANPASKFPASVPCDSAGRPLTGSKGSGTDIPGDSR